MSDKGRRSRDRYPKDRAEVTGNVVVARRTVETDGWLARLKERAGNSPYASFIEFVPGDIVLTLLGRTESQSMARKHVSIRNLAANEAATAARLAVMASIESEVEMAVTGMSELSYKQVDGSYDTYVVVNVFGPGLDAEKRTVASSVDTLAGKNHLWLPLRQVCKVAHIVSDQYSPSVSADLATTFSDHASILALPGYVRDEPILQLQAV